MIQKVVLIISCLFILFQYSFEQCLPNRACYPPLKEYVEDTTNKAITLTATSTCGAPETFEGLGTTDNNTFTCNVENNVDKMRDRKVVTFNVAGQEISRTDPNLETYYQSDKTLTSDSTSATEQIIELQLGGRFTIKDVKIYFKALNSPKDAPGDPRPKAIYFEKQDSVGGPWTPWRYYADNCADFSGVEEQKEGQPSLGATASFCVKEGHKIGGLVNSPHEDTRFVEFNPGLEFGDEFSNSKVVADHYVTNGIRIHLVKPNFETPLQSYYAISDLSVSGYCYCYGHGSACVNSADCVCVHNTEGLHCEQCMPLYNNQTWMMGKTTQANECQKCFCNEHAESCHYDADKGYGVCDNCVNSTTGDFCDKCIPGFSVNSYYTRDKTNETTPLAKPTGSCQDLNGQTYDCGSYCIPCGCSLDGTKADSLAMCATDGECGCKTNVQGQKCNECKDLFWGLAKGNVDGCTVCDCDVKGTVNNTNLCNKTTSECFCKKYTIGAKCDSCMPNSFGLSSDNEDGCKLCGCDPGASKSNQCDINNSGQCECRQNIEDRDCRKTVTGYFAPKLDHLRFEAEFQDNILEENKVDRPGEGVVDGTVSGRGLVAMPTSNSIELVFKTQLNNPLDIVLRYEFTASANIPLQGSIKQVNGAPYDCDGSTITADQVWSIQLDLKPAESRGAVIITRICGKINQEYTLTISTATASSLLIDSIVVLPVIDKLQQYTNANDAEKEKMNMCREASLGVNLPNRKTLNCTEVEYSLMTEIVDGAMECGCSTSGTKEGTVCEQYGGQCQCKEGVTMRDCSICRVDSFGLNITQGCTLCNCNAHGSSKQSCDQNGDCSCKTNVTGKQCDECFPNQFGLALGNGCQECQCNLLYAINNTCQDDGQCLCKPGIGLTNCDACSPGFYNLTGDGCSDCGCHSDGSVNNVCNDGTGVCNCKPKTVGNKCDQCVTGYFGVGSYSDEGCIKCLCSGHTDNCTSGQGWYNTTIFSSWSATDKSAVDDRWLGQDVEGNDVMVDDEFLQSTMLFVMRIVNNVKNLEKSHLYFSAPAKYMGDKRSAYGRYFTMTLRLSTHDELLGNYTEGDICIKGKYTDFVLAKDIALPGLQGTEYTIPLKESEWYINGTDSAKPTYIEFMQVLSAIEFIKVRGKWSNATDAETDLFEFHLYTAVKQVVTGSEMINNVEECVCPPEYAGDFCELCADGFKRETPNGGPFSKCIPCRCNGHGSGACAVDTGVCNCTHNTKGDHCEICMDGYYGNPITGKPDDCKPCMCPGNVVEGEVNVFAKTCTLDDGGGPKCANCSEGHGGNQCEICLKDFYGQPINPQVNGGKCVSCECNGRADTCDTTTGICVDCKQNTTGQKCDICAAKYFGDAMTNDCKLCVCDPTGSTGNCNAASGQCECLPNIQGFNCNTCVPNSFNFSSGQGCQMCDCHSDGAIGATCQSVTGQCTCRANVINRQCNACKDTYYQLNRATGCNSCECTAEGTAEANVTGGVKGVCDLNTGDCTCQQPGIIGRTCNSCSKNTKGVFSDFVTVFSIGEYPNCVLCGECFDNWAKKMDDIGLELNNIAKETNDVWASYGFKTQDSVKGDLQDISTGIQNANQSVSRAQNITDIVQSLTQELFMIIEEVHNISSMLVDIETRLNSSLDSLNTVSTFDGAVNINNESYTADILNTSLTQLTNELTSAFDRANKAYTHIQELSVLVGSADQMTQQLQSRVQTAMSTLAVAQQTFNSAEQIYNTTFLNGFNDNKKSVTDILQTLTESKALLKELNVIIGDMSTQFASANESMTTVITKSDQTRDRLSSKLQESQQTLTSAQELASISSSTSNLVTAYKTTTDKALRDITGAFEAIVDGSKQLIEINNKIQQSTGIVTQVNAIEIRPDADMVALTTQIRDTTISDADVSAANTNAENALATAKEVLNITEKALKDSRSALDEVQGIQRNINDATIYRTNASSLKSETDAGNITIHQAIDQTDSKINMVANLVTQATGDVTNVQSFINKVSKCYQETQSTAGTSRDLAAVAHQQAQAVEQEQSEYAGIETTLNTAVASKSTGDAVNEIQQTKTQLDGIVRDLSTAQDIADLTNMIQEYGQQKTEMNQLQTDIDALERQLDDMLQALEVTSQSPTCVHS